MILFMSQSHFLFIKRRPTVLFMRSLLLQKSEGEQEHEKKRCLVTVGILVHLYLSYYLTRRGTPGQNELIVTKESRIRIKFLVSALKASASRLEP